MSTATLPSLLTTYDVAHWLGVPHARVLRMVRDEAIPHSRLPSGDVVFSAAALADWIQERAVRPEVNRAE